MKVYIGADHRGFKLKEEVKIWLMEIGIAFKDFGAYKLDNKDDYTVYAKKVANAIADNNKKGLRDMGVLFCGSGVGMDVTANKIDGVRASIGVSVEQVKAGRNDDDMNILVIAADSVKEKKAKEMIKAFLETDFSGKAHHKRRLDEIKKIEETN